MLTNRFTTLRSVSCKIHCSLGTMQCLRRTLASTDRVATATVRRTSHVAVAVAALYALLPKRAASQGCVLRLRWTCGLGGAGICLVCGVLRLLRHANVLSACPSYCKYHASHAKAAPIVACLQFLRNTFRYNRAKDGGALALAEGTGCTVPARCYRVLLDNCVLTGGLLLTAWQR